MITQQNNGSEISAYINAELANAGSEVTIGNESGLSVATKLNGVFGEELILSSQSCSQFAQAVEEGIESLDGGDTPTPPTPEDDHIKMRFLHVSDTHGTTPALSQCRDMLVVDDDIEALIVSGDFQAYNAGTASRPHSNGSQGAYVDGETLALAKGKNKCCYHDSNLDYSAGEYKIYENNPPLTNINGENRLLYILGNHDRLDTDYTQMHFLDSNGDEINTGIATGGKLVQSCNWLHYLLGDSVNYGATINCGYWYRDFTKTAEVNGETVTKTVRVIGIHDYENSSSSKLVAYTQTQVNWFLDLLASTPSDYFIVCITHESPFKESTAEGNHTAALAMRPQNETEANGVKLFVSELHSSFHERGNEINVNLLPMIMNAYLTSQNLNTTYVNNVNFGTVNLVKDFSNITPATFVGWLCGHNHDDYTGYMPSEDYDNQLLLGIAASDGSTYYAGSDDLRWNFNENIDNKGGYQYATNEPSYRINELIIDCTAKTLTVKRHGNMTTSLLDKPKGAARPYGGRVRDEITFNLIGNNS